MHHVLNGENIHTILCLHGTVGSPSYEQSTSLTGLLALQVTMRVSISGTAVQFSTSAGTSAVSKITLNAYYICNSDPSRRIISHSMI